MEIICISQTKVHHKVKVKALNQGKKLSPTIFLNNMYNKTEALYQSLPVALVNTTYIAKEQLQQVLRVCTHHKISAQREIARLLTRP